MQKFDKVIIGAGMYGLYAARNLGQKGFSVLVIDCDEGPFQRGSYINQARLHNGYHYPRSYSTAKKSSHYFKRFLEEFSDCINTKFEKLYAISKEYSWTNAEQFQLFCDHLGLKCQEIKANEFFNYNTISKSFITEEFTFDASLLREKLFEESNRCEFLFSTTINSITKKDNDFILSLSNGEKIITDFVLNASYAGVNQIHNLMDYPQLDIKYELCEVVLCDVSENIKNVGLTVMDGPFFSVMPFGKTNFHSITTVSRTPHMTSYDRLPTFPCQEENRACTPERMLNCNHCFAQPKSAFNEMRQLSKKYLNPNIDIQFQESLFTLKPILMTSEIDDSRPTIIKKYSEKPDFFTVFSGKINTMYDLNEILNQ